MITMNKSAILLVNDWWSQLTSTSYSLELFVNMENLHQEILDYLVANIWPRLIPHSEYGLRRFRDNPRCRNSKYRERKYVDSRAWFKTYHKISSLFSGNSFQSNRGWNFARHKQLNITQFWEACVLFTVQLCPKRYISPKTTFQSVFKMYFFFKAQPVSGLMVVTCLTTGAAENSLILGRRGKSAEV